MYGLPSKIAKYIMAQENRPRSAFPGADSPGGAKRSSPNVAYLYV
jgi:hypothetical protein